MEKNKYSPDKKYAIFDTCFFYKSEVILDKFSEDTEFIILSEVLKEIVKHHNTDRRNNDGSKRLSEWGFEELNKIPYTLVEVEKVSEELKEHVGLDSIADLCIVEFVTRTLIEKNQVPEENIIVLTRDNALMYELDRCCLEMKKNKVEIVTSCKLISEESTSLEEIERSERFDVVETKAIEKLFGKKTEISPKQYPSDQLTIIIDENIENVNFLNLFELFKDSAIVVLESIENLANELKNEREEHPGVSEYYGQDVYLYQKLKKYYKNIIHQKWHTKKFPDYEGKEHEMNILSFIQHGLIEGLGLGGEQVVLISDNPFYEFFIKLARKEYGMFGEMLQMGTKTEAKYIKEVAYNLGANKDLDIYSLYVPKSESLPYEMLENVFHKELKDRIRNYTMAYDEFKLVFKDIVKKYFDESQEYGVLENLQSYGFIRNITREGAHYVQVIRDKKIKIENLSKENIADLLKYLNENLDDQESKRNIYIKSILEYMTTKGLTEIGCIDPVDLFVKLGDEGYIRRCKKKNKRELYYIDTGYRSLNKDIELPNISLVKKLEVMGTSDEIEEEFDDDSVVGAEARRLKEIKDEGVVVGKPQTVTLNYLDCNRERARFLLDEMVALLYDPKVEINKIGFSLFLSKEYYVVVFPKVITHMKEMKKYKDYNWPSLDEISTSTNKVLRKINVVHNGRLYTGDDNKVQKDVTVLGLSKKMNNVKLRALLFKREFLDEGLIKNRSEVEIIIHDKPQDFEE